MSAPRATWRTVDVDGARVRLMEAGHGEPLLFLHGWGLSPDVYAEGICRLTASGVRVLAPALPGFGGSDAPDRVDLATYAARVGRLLDVLGVDVPVFVAGHSFGGGVALRLATDRPERVRSLTLVSSVGGAPSQRAGLADAAWARWALGAVAEVRPLEVARSVPSVLRAFLPHAVRRPLLFARTAHLALTASLADEAAALVARGLPLLMVWGDDDQLIAPGELGDVVADLPAEVVHGRHGWLLSHPEEFATLLRNALVVHAMLERRRRGMAGVRAGAGPEAGPGTVTRALVLPQGVSLADLIPPERRSVHRRSGG